MSVDLKELGLTYYPITKTGSTSIKYALMTLAGKEALVGDLDNDVHRHMGTHYTDPFRLLSDERAGRFTIVRDPLDRLLSAFSNRIGHFGILQKFDRSALDRLGLEREPSLETFVLDIEKYCAVSSDLRLHIASPRCFVGSSLLQFDHVFRFERLEEVAAFLSEQSGKSIDIPRLQTGGAKYTPADLSPEALAKALRFCRYDYAFLVDYYDPAKWGGIPAGHPGDASTVTVAGNFDASIGGVTVYPRTFRNFARFLSRRPLRESGVDYKDQ
jgi:hypothetical protein